MTTVPWRLHRGLQNKPRNAKLARYLWHSYFQKVWGVTRFQLRLRFGSCGAVGCWTLWRSRCALQVISSSSPWRVLHSEQALKLINVTFSGFVVRVLWYIDGDGSSVVVTGASDGLVGTTSTCSMRNIVFNVNLQRWLGAALKSTRAQGRPCSGGVTVVRW